MNDKKVISFETAQAKFRKPQDVSHRDDKVPGQLVWLYCPACETLEYTSVVAPYGRTHKCGAAVLEQSVDIDLRAEFTVAIYNISIADRLTKGLRTVTSRLFFKKAQPTESLRQLEENERTYISHLLKAAGNRKLEVLDVTDKEQLLGLINGIVETKPLGIVLSPFRLNPKERFRVQEDA